MLKFCCGIFTLSQFGIGLISVSQFTIAGFALAQIGVYIHEGHGQIVKSLEEIIRLLT
jgi:hypothetical protein